MAFLNRKFPSISSNSSSPTSLLRPDASHSLKVTDILVCNTTASDATISIFIREQSTENTSLTRNDIHFVKDMLVPANTSIEIIDGSYPIYHKLGTPWYDHLMAYASASGIDLILGYYLE